VGIEIEISKKNNITVVESNTHKRFRVLSYDEASNFSQAEEYEDIMPKVAKGKEASSSEKVKDLLNSELFELKNIWFMYNKKINSVLAILPQEVLNRYDMIAKTLTAPVFDVTRYPHEDKELSLIFDEIIYKMA
jgi:flagellar motor switch protein FliG